MNFELIINSTPNEVVIALLNDKIVQNGFGKAARNKIISNFNSDVVAKKTIAFYENFLKK